MKIDGLKFCETVLKRKYKMMKIYYNSMCLVMRSQQKGTLSREVIFQN